jgi:hypothetical protein
MSDDADKQVLSLARASACSLSVPPSLLPSLSLARSLALAHSLVRACSLSSARCVCARALSLFVRAILSLC